MTSVKPYYEDPAGITIYCGDCREILPRLKPVLVLTDPPYGVGDTPENVRRLVAQVIPLCIKISKRVNLTCGTRQIHFYPEPTWILCWLNRAGSFPNPWGFTCWQPILCYGPDPYLEAGKGSRSDVIEHSETAEKFDHPCPKPERFWTKLLARCSIEKSELIVDPFMGTGSTLVAAKNLGHPAVGMDVEERFCEIAAKRVQKAFAHPDMVKPSKKSRRERVRLF